MEFPDCPYHTPLQALQLYHHFKTCVAILLFLMVRPHMVTEMSSSLFWAELHQLDGLVLNISC